MYLDLGRGWHRSVLIDRVKKTFDVAVSESKPVIPFTSNHSVYFQSFRLPPIISSSLSHLVVLQFFGLTKNNCNYEPTMKFSRNALLMAILPSSMHKGVAAASNPANTIAVFTDQNDQASELVSPILLNIIVQCSHTYDGIQFCLDRS